MILYFSGTGNSQFVAFRLAELLADKEVVSMNRYMKSGETAAIHSDRPLVFVAPTYAWRMPRVVERWIMEASFQGSLDAYFILTCGGSCGNAAVYAKKLCRKKNLHFRGLAEVIMPENYLALFSTPDEGESRKIIENAGPVLAALGKRILAEQPFEEAAVSLAGKLESGPINPLFYALFVHDKGFWGSDRCVSCGTCARRCPLNNIDLVDGKPVWGGSCTHCMGCIGSCPTEAIEYKSRTKGRRRHDIMNDTLCGGRKATDIEDKT